MSRSSNDKAADAAADIKLWDIPGYELLELIHPGTVVYVYRAWQHSLKRNVVIRTLNPRRREDSHDRAAIARAAEILSRYEHPNIVPVVDFGHHNGVPYIVSQWMRGGNLRQYLKEKLSLQRNHLPPRKVATIIKQLGNALDYLHSQGQVQGDPCPTNVAVDMWGNAYISDFVKRAFDETDPSGRGCGALRGMYDYMAPERWREHPPTPLTDQYALGAIAYELITGKPPFQWLFEANQQERGVPRTRDWVQEAHLSQPVPPAKLFRSIVSDTVCSVLARSLAKEPEQRYPNVGVFVRAFQDAILDTPTEVFVSYSRSDSAYKTELKEDLVRNGFDVWTDDKIEHGDQWFHQINEAIRRCAAVVVIMSPRAESSEWVHKEILLSKRYKKTLFPLLLEGAEFPILIDTQFENVSDNNPSMPSPGFYSRLSEAVHGTK